MVALFDKYAKKSAKKAHKTLRKARSHTSEHALAKITHVVDDKRQFINSPPLLVRLTNLVTEEERETARAQGTVEKAWQEYKRSVPEERRRLLARYPVTDGAFLVQGVFVNGSLSKSPVNDEAGARSQISNLAQAALIILTLHLFS